MEPEFQTNKQYHHSWDPTPSVLSFLSAYGWWVVGAAIAITWGYNKAEPHIRKWRNQQDDARHHKDPDQMLKRMEAIQAARENQQKKLEEDAKLYQQKEKEREEKKRQDFIERNSIANKVNSSGNVLGAKPDYLPLAGAGPSGGYRPPKKSKCSGGGCGK